MFWHLAKLSMFESPGQTAAPSLGRTIHIDAAAAVDFRRIWLTIWSGRNTILWGSAIGLVLALLFVLVAPHKFTAVTEILIDPTDLHAIGNDPSPANQSSDAAVLAVESQLQVLTSDNVLRRVVDTEGLADDFDFASGAKGLSLFGELSTAFSQASNAAVVDRPTAAVMELRRRIQVRRTERTYVVGVSVTDNSPIRAARLANAVAQAYLVEQTQVRADAARQIALSLSARLKELKDNVHQAEERVEAYKAHNAIIGANGQLVDEQQLAEMNNQLSAARARTAEAKAQFDSVATQMPDDDERGAFPAALQSPTLAMLRSQYAEVIRREAEQTTSLGERHPAVIEILAQADRLRHLIDAEITRTKQSLRSAYESAKAEENALAANLETLKRTAMNTDEAMVGLRELERDVQANRDVYQAFLLRSREAVAQEQLDTKNIRIISRADPPLRRSSPASSMLIAMVGVIFGSAGGAGFVLARAEIYGSSRAVSASRDRPSNLSILAVFPQVDIPFALHAAANPKSAFAREVDNLKRSLSPGAPVATPQTILFVASNPDDGTAAVPLALAAVAAKSQQVLLVDVDRDGRILSAFNVDDHNAGLIDVASGRRSLAEIVVRDRETGINLVALMSRFNRSNWPINKTHINKIFNEIRNFDLVVFVALDFGADAATRLFARPVDHIVLVAPEDELFNGAVDQFLRYISFAAQKVRGTALIESDSF